MPTSPTDPAVTGSRADRPTSRRPDLADRLALLITLAVGALYSLRLSAQGTANPYYAAAAQAAGRSWRAWFFGAVDSGGAITIDKPPASIWLMGLSTRLFGQNPWSLLLPQALLGAATVALLYLTVRRSAGATAGLVAAGVLAVTPVAVVIFRFDNPDALLTFLLVAAAYLLLRLAAAAPGRAPWWAAAVGCALGLAFLTKSLQIALVLPALVLAGWFAVPGSRRRRLGLGAVVAGSFAASAGWWLIAVQAWPPLSRPYIGGSTDNSILNVTFGLNGVQRLSGDKAGPFGTGPSPFAGPPGPFRLVNYAFAGQLDWFLPLAAICGLIALQQWRAHRLPRPMVAAHLLWGVWAATFVVTLSVVDGVIHAYYLAAAAPAVAALIGMGAAPLARLGASPRTVWVPVLAILGSAAVGTSALHRAPHFLPWLLPLLLVLAIACCATLLVLARRPGGAGRAATAVVVLGAATVLAGPLAWSGATVAASQSSGDPKAGPVLPGAVTSPPVDRALAAFLRQRFDQAVAGGDRRLVWVAAAVGADPAAPLQLATRLPVVMLGGFDGVDGGPTPATVQGWVAQGRLRYVIQGAPSIIDAADAGHEPARAVVGWARLHGRVVAVPGSGAVVYDVSGVR